jgi:hypothetical protein
MELLGREGLKYGGLFAPPVVISRLLLRVSSMPVGNVLELDQQDLQHIIHPYRPAGPSQYHQHHHHHQKKKHHGKHHHHSSSSVGKRGNDDDDDGRGDQSYEQLKKKQGDGENIDLADMLNSKESSQLIDSDLFIEALLDECTAAAARASTAGRTLWSLECNHARRHRMIENYSPVGDDAMDDDQGEGEEQQGGSSRKPHKKKNKHVKMKEEWKAAWPGTAASIHNLLLLCITRK